MKSRANTWMTIVSRYFLEVVRLTVRDLYLLMFVLMLTLSLGDSHLGSVDGSFIAIHISSARIATDSTQTAGFKQRRVNISDPCATLITDLLEWGSWVRSMLRSQPLLNLSNSN